MASQGSSFCLSICSVSCFVYCLHAARYTKRCGYRRQDADGYLNDGFPSFLFHVMRILVRYLKIEVDGERLGAPRRGLHLVDAALLIVVSVRAARTACVSASGRAATACRAATALGVVARLRGALYFTILQCSFSCCCHNLKSFFSE